jgi:hypothetical protein
MKFFYPLSLILYPFLVFAGQPTPVPINFPVTIKAGTQASPFITPDFPVPDNQTGDYSVTLPCDPAWGLRLGIQLSTDNGKTWNCDDDKVRCQGYRFVPGPCVDRVGKPLPTKTLIWRTTKGALSSQTKMRIRFVSNLTKSVTVTITFDPL